MPIVRKRNLGESSPREEARRAELDALILRNKINWNRRKAVKRMDEERRRGLRSATIVALAFLHLRPQEKLGELLDEELVRKWHQHSNNPRGRIGKLIAYFGLSRSEIARRAKRLKLK